MTVRVAIVGSGPSGFYTADALLRSDGDYEIDIIDRLPTPFGLIRAGVAPDHQKTKNVSRAYEKTALNEKITYFGNVHSLFFTLLARAFAPRTAPYSCLRLASFFFSGASFPALRLDSTLVTNHSSSLTTRFVGCLNPP